MEYENTFRAEKVESDPLDTLVAMAKRSPARAIAEARRRLSTLDDDPDGQPAARLRWAEGIALFELGNNAEALASLKVALGLATGEIHDRIAVSLAAAEAGDGDPGAASVRLEQVIERADTTDPVVSALARSQLGLVCLHTGELRRCLDLLRLALPALEQAADEQDAVARVWGNIGHCELLLGELVSSRSSHERAITVAKSTGQMLVVAGALQNLGYIDTLDGDFPNAIRQLEAARLVYADMGNAARRNLVTLYDDLAETYRLAGLASEALRYARVALWIARDGTNREKQADAEFRRARCLLDAGQLRAGLTSAERAQEIFKATDRPLMAHRALMVMIEGQVEPNDETAVHGDAVIAARELEAAGWLLEAVSLRNALAERLIAKGERDQETPQRGEGNPRYLQARLVLTDGRVALAQTTVVGQLEQCRASLLLCVVNDEDVAPALNDAFTVLRQHRARLADPELRLGAASLSERFRVRAVRDALDRGTPEFVLQVEERWRGLAAASRQPARSVDTELGERTAELRSLTRLSPDDRPADCNERIGQLESWIRARSHTQQAASVAHWSLDQQDGEADSLDMTKLADRLVGRCFVEWITVERELYRVSVEPSGKTVTACCADLTLVSKLAGDLRYRLDRLVRSRAVRSEQMLMAQSVANASAQLSQVLFGPDFGSVAKGVDMVVAPPGDLMDLPWALLVPEGDRTITVTPSAALWLRDASDSTGSNTDTDTSARGAVKNETAALVVGPGLDHGRSDGEAFASAFPAGEQLHGGQATVARLHQLFLGSSLVHIAAHGRFRDDNPRFSSLDMIDGQVTIGEVEALAHAPRIVILAVCEAGRSLAAGTGAHGAATSLLALGAHCVIAPAVAVPDEEVAHMFEHFYRALPGTMPQAALAAAQQRVPLDEPRLWATAHSFTCIGHDTRIIQP